ncbi:MAG: DNA-binding protein [Prevotellaceae bacterium]|nr:DNA-binding protein [Prevotellaceae bacterium]
MALEFLIRYRVSSLVTSKGETVYYAEPKSSHIVQNEEVVKRIVEATSLATGDVRNALTSLAEVVCSELSMGNAVDLAELGLIRLVVSSRHMRSADEVTVEDALKAPQVRFTPKAKMLKAARKVKMSIDHSMVMPARTRAKKKED